MTDSEGPTTILYSLGILTSQSVYVLFDVFHFFMKSRDLKMAATRRGKSMFTTNLKRQSRFYMNTLSIVAFHPSAT